MSRRAFRRAAIAAAGFAAFSAAMPQASAEQVVLVPSRVIYPGETLDPSVLRQVVLKPGKVVPDAVAVLAEELDGKVARRTLLPGRYIPIASLREAWLIEQGAAVQAVFVAGGLTISASAVTLEPGAAGDLVKVRNIDSGKVFTGTVMADGSVRVGAS